MSYLSKWDSEENAYAAGTNVFSHRGSDELLNDLNQSIPNKSDIESITTDATSKSPPKMEKIRGGRSSVIDLRLNLNAPLTSPNGEAPRVSMMTYSSPPPPPPPQPRCSCICSDLKGGDINCNNEGYVSLVVMGCTRCLMYVMTSEVEPQCPNCKGTALLDLFREKASSV